MEVKLDMPKGAELEAGAQRMLALAQGYKIDSPAMYDAAADDLKKVKGKAKELEEQRKAITAPLDQAKKAVMDLFRKPAEFLEQAEAVLKGAMLTYTRDEQRRADELARQQAEAARFERERIEAEARAKAEEAAKLAAAGDTRAADEAQAQAVALQSTATIVTAPAMTAPVAKVSGITTKEVWSARITDKAALIAHIAAHPECLDWVEVKMTPLNQMAKALKANMRIPGVEAFADSQMAVRAA